MHQASASSTGLDFLPPSRNLYSNSHYPSTYTQTGWPRSQLPPTNAPIHRYATPDSTSRSTALGPSVADRERWLQYASNIPAISTRGRLPTPPADDMSVHQPQQSTTNSVRQGITFPSIASYQTSASTLGYPYNFTSRAAEALKLGSTASSASQLYDDRSHNGAINGVEERVQEVVPRKESIHSSVQATPPVKGGSIGELAAQLTCLFWFETTETLRKAENWTPSSSPVERIAPDAIPTSTFRKWVLTILSTTQVTPNVILLALMFIYRLKTLNPTVKGKAGSEYRLLTVALMLGNKFLDDNTYTNKTWAEVSGISVVEIHVMEVEFLGSMRYSLLASKEQWAEWQVKLGKFGDYFEQASKLPLPLPSPVSNTFPSTKLPSPTRVQSHSPISATNLSNSSSFELSQQWPSQYTSSQPLPQLPQATKKRPFDDLWVEPPPKRPATIAAAHIPAVMVQNSQVAAQRQQAPRLPVPQLSVSTSSGTGYPAFAQTLPPLPPLNGRAMSQVFPATPSWAPNPQVNVPASGMPPQTQQAFSLPGSNHGTPSRRHSPRSIGVHSMNSSPISGIFPSTVHDLNSPSIFLQQRNSPYKPIRLPNTLLYPPPQSSYQHFQPGVDQMHYQPLGKRNDYRSGVVPEYAANPIYQHYPSLPQPTFHPLA